jgi:hypothetical protein
LVKCGILNGIQHLKQSENGLLMAILIWKYLEKLNQGWISYALNLQAATILLAQIYSNSASYICALLST